MISAPIPSNEDERIKELRRYQILDTPAERDFDDITKMAANICGAEIAVVSLVDVDRQWFKSVCGLPGQAETSRSESFCGWTILSDEIFIVDDPSSDERFCGNPVVSLLNIKFYAGVPLVTPNGQRIGTLCIIHKDSLSLSETQKQSLQILAKNVMNSIELRLKHRELLNIAIQNKEIQRISQTAPLEISIPSCELKIYSELADIFGPTFEEVDFAKNWLGSFEGADRLKLQMLLQTSIEQGTEIDAEFRLINSQKWVRFLARPVLENGLVLKLLGALQDITAIKKTSSEIENQHAEIEAFSKGLDQHSCIIKFDVNAQVSYVNDLFCTLTGFTRSECLGKNHHEIYASFQSSISFDEIWDIISRGNVWRGQVKHLTKKGVFVWFNTTMTPIFDGSGKIKEYVTFSYDISKKKLIEEKLQQSELRHRILFDQSAEAITTISEPYKVFSSVNASCVKLFGASSIEEICKLGPSDISPEYQEDGELSSEKAKRMLGIAHREGSHFFEWTHKKLDGKLISCTVLLSKISEGDNVLVQSTIRDISDQKRTEKSLLAYRKQLEKTNANLDFALDAGNLGLWDWNLKNHMINFDSRMAKMLGITDGEMMCKLSEWESLIHPDDYLRRQRSLKQFLNGEVAQYENILRVKHQEGHYVHILFRGKFSEYDENLTPVRFTGIASDLTEHKTLEYQLVEAQSISKIGSWSFNILTQRTVWSSENYKIFEIPEPQNSAKLFQMYHERIHPEDVSTLQKLIEKATLTGEDFVFDHRVYLDNGSRIKHVQAIAKVTKDKDGKPVIISGTCRDRTYDVETQENHRILLETMSEGLLFYDTPTTIKQFNSAALNILALRADNLDHGVVINHYEHFFKEDGTLFTPEEYPVNVVFKTGESVEDITMGFNHHEEGMRWIRINAVPLEGNEGRHVLVTFTDVTDLVRVNAENRFVLETLGIGLWKFRPDQNQQIWDRAMFRIHDVDYVEGASGYDLWSNLLSEESRKNNERDFEAVKNGKNEINSTYDIITRTGEKRYIGTRANVLRKDDGQIDTIYGINWDRTKEIALEQELQLERAKALHNSKLASIGHLAAGVGHEINNPLAIISGQVSIAENLLISAGFSNNEVFERFRRIDLSVTRIGNIVKGLRAFARSDENQTTNFDVNELVDETFQMLKEIYTRDGIDLRLDATPVKLYLYGNRGRIQQLLVNLIANAKDATETRPERIVGIKTNFTNGELLIGITDNGCGIPPQLKEKIFEPFFTTKDVNKGTGIGLSLVNTIVKEHDGRINVETTVGEGTTFTIHLKVSKVEKMESSSGAVSSVDIEFKKIKVLILDDEEDLREILAHKLKSVAREVITAETAEEALEKLATEDVDLVISDVKMPGTDGFQFLEALRKTQNIRQPKFLFITGGVDVENLNEKVEGFNVEGFLSKPFKDEIILKKLKELFLNQDD
jgi:PAS domain S-box-containing protein